MVQHWMYLLWLLLPLAAASGWWAARRSRASAQRVTGTGMSPEYFRGLNYVLNEQPDKAIEVFVRIAEVDSETVETHLALGNLFRRRGEVDRAIRIHQNLIARPTLNRDQRALALLELGIDYMRSGLLDRAEGLFMELVETGAYTAQAFRQLLDIYQQEKDWPNAVVIARRLETTAAENMDPIIAQYYCELACESLEAGNETQARDHLKKALNIDSRCVRVSLLEGELARKAGNIKGAIKALKRIERQDPDYLPEALTPLFLCYREMGKLEEFRTYLARVVDIYGGITSLLLLTDLTLELEGQQAAVHFLSDELKKRPTVRGVERLIEYAMDKAEGEIRDSLTTIRDLFESLVERRSVYKCTRCGFDAKLLHWQCPSCKKWSSVKPVHGVEGE